jgi:Tol biopolymer transport system component
MWSPDGTHIAFATSTGELRIVDVDGRDLRRIGDPAMSIGLPTWSPDGTWIAMRETIDPGMYRGFVIHPDGTDQTPITGPFTAGESHMGFAWSPNGRSVAFHTVGSTDLDIATSRLEADGTWRQEILIDGWNFDELPAWSNDGRRLAFIRTEGVDTPAQRGHVVVATADGKDARVVGDRDIGHYWPPCWSPDDRTIQAMSRSSEDLLPVLDLVAVDSSGVIEISGPGGVTGACAWQRLAP